MKPTLPRYTLLSFCFILFSFATYAQDMEVTDAITAPYTPENLITNVFLGDGVEVTSFQYDGDPEAIGFFKSAEEEIGIERGILMTTGRAMMSNSGHPGATGGGGEFAGGAASPNITVDADLSQLDPSNPNNDISRYIISFIPTSDTVRFNYVFASEEYPEYSCSSFNDVFGFFISGPGINGPFSNNAENIALIPNSATYVSINNLHPEDSCPAVNEEYYNPNGGSSQPTYDGYTDVFTAEAIVIPCQEYTIKLVIADKGDTAFDSGVFLQAKSFGSPSLDIDIVTASLDGAVVEGCADGVITIALPSPVETDLALDYEIFGIAENGVDFEFIPQGLFIPAGESEINVPLIAIEDGIDEGSETFGISFQTNFCDRDTFYLSIKDNELVDPDLGADVTQCASESVTLDGTIDIPLPPVPTFTNETDYLITPVGVAVSSTIGVSGVQPLTLGAGVIRAVCMNINHNWDDDIDVFLQSPGGQFIELTTDNGGTGNDYIETCFTEGASTQISFPGPFAPNTAAPFTGNWLPEGTWSDLYDGEYPTNGEWQLLVIDDSNGFTGSLLDWTITFEPSYQIYYEWTPSEGLSCDDCPMPDASPDVSTMYNLTAFDTYGCEVYDSIFIEVIPAIEAPNVVCSGITLECLTFSWEDIGAPNGYEVNVDGTGWIPVNGADGLSHETCGLGAEQTITIEVQGLGAECNSFIGTGECTTPACEVPTVVMQNETDVSCAGGNDGTLSIEMMGNFPPFTYQIDGQIEENVIIANFTDLTADLHDLVIIDASGCELTLQVLIGEPEGMSLDDVLIQNIQCNGADDGSAAVVVTNGQYPLAFEWTSGETDSVAVNLGQGPALVTVTDVQGCEIVGNIFIDEPMEMTVALDTEAISCNGDNTGAITSTVEGGEGLYTYDWVGTGQTTPNATGLIAGDYTLIVTDENMCTVTELINVDESAAITTSFISSQATCSGTGDGTATIAAGGGTGAGVFNYEWSDDNNSTTAAVTGLDVGWYYVTVSDAITFPACTKVDSIEITAPNAMNIDFTEVTTSCFDTTDGASSITVIGGTMPYTYVWSDGGDEISDRDDLAEGIQTMTVTDANDCFVEVELNIPSPDEITLTITENNAAECTGTSTGSLTVEATGGTGTNYTYLWNDTNTQAAATANNLAGATNYCVTVFDENNCSATICDDVIEPEELAVTETIENVSCFSGTDGQITVTVTGGTEPYGYEWTDGQTTQTAIDLPQGTVQVTITDFNNCTTTANYTVDEPTELTASTGFTALSCDGTPDGTATVTGLGGTEPYTYSWEGGQTTQTAINLDASLYNVTVIDAQGCEATSNVTLTEPVEVIIDGINPTNVTCFGGEDGAATVVYSGGTAPFDITWSNSETGETVTTLTAGTYTVNISDQSGCNASESIIIEEPEDLNITLSQIGSFCNNGTDGTASVDALSYGNTPADLTAFTYEWSNSQSTVNATNLVGGQVYEVIITDAVGCQWTESIEISNPAAINALVENKRDVSCFEGNDGVGTVAGGGGSAPYTYQWPATADNQTTAMVDDLVEGAYMVTVADANGCQTSIELRIEQPEILDLSLSAKDASCFGIEDGEATAIATGGTAPYVLAWSSGISGTTQTELPSDMYVITVVDANNCSYFDSIGVFQPEPVLTTFDTTGVSCYGYRDGFIDLESNGGTAPYTYSLDGENFFGSSRLIGLEVGIYDVTIKDGNGCEFEISDVEITEPDEFIIDLGEDRFIEYGEEFQLSSNLSGSAGGETYEWNPIRPLELDCYDCSTMVFLDTFSGQAAFELTITDREGCTASDIVTIFVNKEVNVEVPTGFSPNGDGRNDLLFVHGDKDIEVKVFRVFDRWGEVVYQSGGFMLNAAVGWDGNFRAQKMPAGIYVWYMEVEAEDGKPAVFKGNTTLIR